MTFVELFASKCPPPKERELPLDPTTTPQTIPVLNNADNLLLYIMSTTILSHPPSSPQQLHTRTHKRQTQNAEKNNFPHKNWHLTHAHTFRYFFLIYFPHPPWGGGGYLSCHCFIWKSDYFPLKRGETSLAFDKTKEINKNHIHTKPCPHPPLPLSNTIPPWCVTI